MSLIKRVWTERRDLIVGIIAGIILGAIFTGGGIFAWNFSNSDKFCVSCHKVMGGYDVKLKQGPHWSKHCIDCHGEETFTDALKVKMFEDPKLLMKYITGNYEVPPHAEITNEFCERCHVSPEKGNRVYFDVSFDHAVHAENLECETCHGRVAHGYTPMPTGHDLCGKCHLNEIRDPAKCSFCHRI
ncbi:MAG TPA: hypothetical protein ENG09_03350 [Candidatus Syntrophoarchaeum butanivorans]|uniref:NapC/NirT cytochrome c N-terminal domain-containing protein n=1 Tax=Candidatus Syntropharchaeum butanivorans TaxID=1839936 RepID=A0A7C0X2U3_9EURY|nr:hypothetical protein [Candidatus Syntrophoarchaeum butanivorans]